jgi:hypothetical protein
MQAMGQAFDGPDRLGQASPIFSAVMATMHRSVAEDFRACSGIAASTRT